MLAAVLEPGFGPADAKYIELFEQLQEGHPRLQISTVRSEMHARDDDLAVTRVDDTTRLCEDIVDRPAPASSPRRWNDAVAARLLAPGLHAQRPCGAAHQAGRDRTAARPVRHQFRHRDVAQDASDFVVIRHDRGHTRQGRDIIGAARGVATGRDDPRRRIVASDASDRLTSALVGAGGHRARVDDHEIGVFGRDRFRSRHGQFGFKRQRVRLIDAAPERDDRVLS